MTFPFDALRRWPDLDSPDLAASDAADRLILDESAIARATAGRADIAVIGDSYGALTLATVADSDDRSALVRVHQDALTGEQAMRANAVSLEIEGGFASHALDADMVRHARIVLMRLPRSLDALRDIARLIAAHAHPQVRVYAGGRIKHMTLAMNDVMRENFRTVDVTHARQKSRVLIAREPFGGDEPTPRLQTHGDGLVVAAYGGAFAGTAIDIGTRFLLENLPARMPLEGNVIDYACGTGVVATTLARRHPDLAVYASDQSAAAVASARATAAENGVADRVTVVRDDLLSQCPPDSAGFIALNPPFHVGAAVSDQLAPRMFADAARVLASGGELWTVWNSALQYRSALERLVGPTRQVARNRKFTVTVSTAR